MISERRPPAVPLEAGIGPENPPCPACEEPLFGWARSPDGAPIRRCEACGLGAVGDPSRGADALEALERLRINSTDGQGYRIANRASLQAWLGGGGWAAIDNGTRYLFTPEAVRRLVAARDQETTQVRWRPGAALTLMWGTLINAFTFGRNVVLGAFGRATAIPARRGWQRALDWFVSVVIALPVLVVALVLETGDRLAGRGGVVDVRLELA
jgi:hypothetical protein